MQPAPREFAVGVQVDIVHGIRFFGTDEVNELIAKVWHVVAAILGGINFKKLSGSGEGANPIFSGCDLKVVMHSPSET